MAAEQKHLWMATGFFLLIIAVGGASRGDEDEGDSEVELGNELELELACSGKTHHSQHGRSKGNKWKSEH